jgi:hypothetical protein
MIHVHTLLIEQCNLDLLASLEVPPVDLAQFYKVCFIPEEGWGHKELLMFDMPLALAWREESPA